jgi:hypothetical protein
MEIINPERKIPESECKSAKQNENRQKFLKNAVSATDYADFGRTVPIHEISVPAGTLIPGKH